MTGSLTPRTYPSETITVRCEECGRLGRYRRTTLIEWFGPDGSMPDILNALTEDCGRNERLSMDRCKAVYGELTRNPYVRL